MSYKIKKIKAREILDSRGNPTVEVKVILEDGIVGIAKVPSGASTGVHEALELRDNNPKRYHGKGVLKACSNVNEKISKILKGQDIREQRKIDEMMIKEDGTENKSKFGANAILGVSLALSYAAAQALKVPLYQYIRSIYKPELKEYKLPLPMFNIINGGKHADSGLAIQEFMLVPFGIKSFREKVRAGSEIFHTLKKILTKKGYSVAVGDEGGFAPKLKTNQEPFELIIKAIKQTGYKPEEEIGITIDAAATSFYLPKKNRYEFRLENKLLTRNELIDLYSKWIEEFPIVAIEDGLQEEDWEGWREMYEKLGKRIQLIGDDFLVTNVKRLKRAIQKKCANSILIKPNQIGTLTETLDCIKMAHENNWKTMVSHRSGETIDTIIADLAVGTNAGQIKSGSLSRGERVCKYNRLMEIEEEIKDG